MACKKEQSHVVETIQSFKIGLEEIEKLKYQFKCSTSKWNDSFSFCHTCTAIR